MVNYPFILSIPGASMMGSTHTYEIGKGRAPVKGKEAAVEMALNPEDLDLMDSETMALKAEAALRYLRIKNFKLNLQKSPPSSPSPSMFKQ